MNRSDRCAQRRLPRVCSRDQYVHATLFAWLRIGLHDVCSWAGWASDVIRETGTDTGTDRLAMATCRQPCRSRNEGATRDGGPHQPQQCVIPDHNCSPPKQGIALLTIVLRCAAAAAAAAAAAGAGVCGGCGVFNVLCGGAARGMQTFCVSPRPGARRQRCYGRCCCCYCCSWQPIDSIACSCSSRLPPVWILSAWTDDCPPVRLFASSSLPKAGVHARAAGNEQCAAFTRLRPRPALARGIPGCAAAQAWLSVCSVGVWRKARGACNDMVDAKGEEESGKEQWLSGKWLHQHARERDAMRKDAQLHPAFIPAAGRGKDKSSLSSRRGQQAQRVSANAASAASDPSAQHHQDHHQAQHAYSRRVAGSGCSARATQGHQPQIYFSCISSRLDDGHRAAGCSLVTSTKTLNWIAYTADMCMVGNPLQPHLLTSDNGPFSENSQCPRFKQKPIYTESSFASTFPRSHIIHVMHRRASNAWLENNALTGGHCRKSIAANHMSLFLSPREDWITGEYTLFHDLGFSLPAHTAMRQNAVLTVHQRWSESFSSIISNTVCCIHVSRTPRLLSKNKM
ncbi:uncharacterized protein MYCFIDRAFT_206693 [Pseudocercospora fijiensis CIRAD86]|uniref:Uncharacterized protein n=1 Tax=Pseudocercospora fijiensis (strain CIRAD86) TaxID=383855 RepID=M3B9R6_PSEFD|nr:uncharacterized protein MYCFIDRAFT_206693 [Pseudocercospora fijiensis CIRAD86]EME86072.1 hypothetical protein MYCFIDRAFT_206693 [Pseudocercospora fijiensis CIRAD86]